MQSWIHPRSPVAAATDVVFHIRPACWQRAWHPLLSCFLPLLLPLSPPLPFSLCFSPLSLTCPPYTNTHLLLLLPLISLSGAVISPVCPELKKKKEKNLPQFDDIIAATHVQPTCSKPWVETTALNCCECESVVKSECQILPLLVSMRVQLHAAAREVVLTMVLFRQENRNIHTHSPNTAATHSVMTFITGTLNECTTTTDMTVLLLLWLLNWGNELLYIIITQQRKDKD